MLDPFLRPGDITAKQAAFALRRVSQESILGITLVYNGFFADQDSGLRTRRPRASLLPFFLPLLAFWHFCTRTDGKRDIFGARVVLEA